MLEAVTDTSTRVSVHTDLTITGKVAQFGRGVLADVSRKLMGQFADNLAELVAADADAGGPETASDSEAAEEPDGEPAEASAPDPAPAEEVEAVDLLSVAGAPMMKRLVPVVLAVILVIVIVVIALAS